MSVRRAGLPISVKMRHNSHYVEDIISRSGAAFGRMIPVEQIQPNADQPRKELGDLKSLTESVRDKGVLEPLLVRYLPDSDKFMIICGERRYHAACAAGVKEVPCVEKDVDEGESLEIALIENLQRKDLTPFEEADGVQALANRYALTHEEIASRIAKSRSSITETLSLRNIPDEVKAQCIEAGVLSKSQLLQVARERNPVKMRDLVGRFALGLVNREQARAERNSHPRPRPAIFNYVPPAKDFRLVLKFRKNHVERAEIIAALRKIVQTLEAERED